MKSVQILPWVQEEGYRSAVVYPAVQKRSGTARRLKGWTDTRSQRRWSRCRGSIRSTNTVVPHKC